MKNEQRDGAPGRLDVRIDEKRYRSADAKSVLALCNLSFSVAAGSFTCLIGPSGCGKTTCLRIILGLDRDFTGTIALPWPSLRMAAVFQEPRLLPWRTAEDNVRLALRADEAAKPLDVLFDTLGLAGFERRYPGELSLGQARRVALARAFAVEPDLLLLDEPFVSLDAETASRLRRLLAELWQERRMTALMVTHNAREAVELADRLIFLTAGPARVVGEFNVPLARSERTPSAVARVLAGMARQFPGVCEGAD